MKVILLIISIFTLSSCSTIKIETKSLKQKDKLLTIDDYIQVEKDDYNSHFKEFERFYLNSSETKLITLNQKNQKYLEEIADSILTNNELFFEGNQKVEFFIIYNSNPFHFSLPGRKIFISSGLLRKYIKSEKLLYCLLTYELIRSEKSIYHKNLIVPTGVINTNRLLSLMRLTTAEKVEIHKWSFYLLKRVGIDTDNYLSWIQIQNRNSIDFSLQLGDINSISREESLFKKFLIKNTKESESNRSYKGSSKLFYKFISSIKS